MMKIYSLYLTYRNIKRLKEILAVLLRHGFYHVVENTDLKKYIPFYTRFLKKRMNVIPGGVAVQLRTAFEDLGPTFIKFGQALSRRRDIIPEDFIDELTKLEDRVTPQPFTVIEKQLISVYGADYREKFQMIEDTPLASASLAQVHCAILKDGQDVVLKIKRLGIDENVQNDFIVMQFLAAFVNKYIPELKDMNIPDIVDEFGRMIKKEMNFQYEIANMEKVRSVFMNDPDIVIPALYKDMSTKDIIVMENVPAVKFTDKEKIRELGLLTPELVVKSLEMFIRKVFGTGIFHGDLHPGNVGITKNGKIVLYDFGNVGFLSQKVRQITKMVLFSLVTRDYESFIELLLEHGLLQDETNLLALERDIIEIFEWRTDINLKQLDITGLVLDITNVARKHKIMIPMELVGFFRTILLMDSIGRAIAPGFSINMLLEKVIETEKTKGFSAEETVKDALKGLHDFKGLLTKFPSQIDRLMRKMLNDKFTVDFVHVNLEPLSDEMKRSSNKVSVSLIISSLIIGSSLVFFSDKGPHLLGYPLLGIVGFVSTMILGLYLLFSIIRGGKF